MLWNPSLMKILLKNEVYGSREQYTDPLTHATIAMCKRQTQTYMGKHSIQTFSLYLSTITYNTSLCQCGILVCLYKNTNSSLYTY